MNCLSSLSFYKVEGTQFKQVQVYLTTYNLSHSCSPFHSFIRQAFIEGQPIPGLQEFGRYNCLLSHLCGFIDQDLKKQRCQPFPGPTHHWGFPWVSSTHSWLLWKVISWTENMDQWRQSCWKITSLCHTFSSSQFSKISARNCESEIRDPELCFSEKEIRKR